MKKIAGITAIALILLSTFCISLFALQARPTIAVVDIKIQKGIDPSVVAPITEAIIEEAVNAKTYVVLDRGYVDKVIKQQEFNLSVMVSNSEVAQVGQFLAADYVVTGMAQKLGDAYYLVVKMIEVKSGAIVWQSSAQSGGKLAVLVDMAHSLGKKIATEPSSSSLQAATPSVASIVEGTKVGLSYPDPNFNGYIPECAQILTEAGCEVLYRDAHADAQQQIKQMKEMADEGAKVIIVIAADSRLLAPMVDELSARGVRVIALDRLITSSSLSAYISYDNVSIGRSQAIAILLQKNKGNFVILGGSPDDNNSYLFHRGQMEILKPSIDSGNIKIVADKWIDKWSPDNAYAQMTKILTDTKGKVDAVVAPNDFIALAAINALRDFGLAGKVPVCGQDASRVGCNSLAKGELSVTILKDPFRLAALVCEYAITLATGKDIPELSRYSLADLTGDQGLKGFVPCIFPPALPITRDNLRRLIVDAGFQTYEDVYRDVRDPPAK